MDDPLRGVVSKKGLGLALVLNEVSIDMVHIPSGEFFMGSDESEAGHKPNEAPLHKVNLTKSFYIGTYEITVKQYRKVMRTTNQAGMEDMLPVSQVTYVNALSFCNRLSKISHAKVRLPSEAEWEYACRAGTKTPYSSGSSETDLDKVAWYSKNSEDRPHPVGQKQPNAWGIFDMHGNVWEYCADFNDGYSKSDSTDPIGQTSPHFGAMRGGGWMHGPEYCRAAAKLVSDDMFGGAGFRVVIDV